MDESIERSLRRWRWIASLAIAATGVLLVALAVMTVLVLRKGRPVDQHTDRRLVDPRPVDPRPVDPPQVDPRLLGTWQSDADRTIATLRERRPLDEGQEAGLRKLFGKLRITYTESAYTIDLEGFTRTRRYEVLGTDKGSVVIHDLGPQGLELSEFTVIHFDGPDSYSLMSSIGDTREYFKRVK